MNYDNHPTMLRHDDAAYARYAASLDKDCPDWFKDDVTKMAPQLAAEALKRRKATATTVKDDKSVSRLLRRANVVRIKPGELLILSNLENITEEEAARIYRWFGKQGVRELLIIQADVQFTVVSKEETDG